MLDVRKLRLLRELAHRETIAAVAQALSYTPSAVSQQLTALEREAGVPLLERSGRRVTLTPAALTLVAHAETILAVLEQAAAELAGSRTDLTGTLRIGAFPTAVRSILSPALIALSSRYPRLELMVTELEAGISADALRAETLDVALLQAYDYVPEAPDAALDSEALLEETIYLAALSEVALSEPAAVTADAGRQETPLSRDNASSSLVMHAENAWIASTPGTLCHRMTVRACQAAGFTPRIRHHADDFGTVLALVGAGQGVALVPELGVLACPPQVRLTPLPTRRRTRLAYRRGTRDHPVVLAARAALQEAMGRTAAHR